MPLYEIDTRLPYFSLGIISHIPPFPPGLYGVPIPLSAASLLMVMPCSIFISFSDKLPQIRVNPALTNLIIAQLQSSEILFGKTMR